jgi:hypothetical protein
MKSSKLTLLFIYKLNWLISIFIIKQNLSNINIEKFPLKLSGYDKTKYKHFKYNHVLIFITLIYPSSFFGICNTFHSSSPLKKQFDITCCTQIKPNSVYLQIYFHRLQFSNLFHYENCFIDILFHLIGIVLFDQWYCDRWFSL